MAYGAAGTSGAFIPDHNASGNLIVGFSRNVNSFPVNRYIEIRPVTKDVGVYLRWKSEQAARRPYNNEIDRIWADGADRPHGASNLEDFEYAYYRTQRYAYSFTLGQKAVQQADWAIDPAHMGMTMQQCMQGRTNLALEALSGATWGDNTSTPATITGGANHWGTGTPTAPYIKQCLNYAALQINKKTLGSVRPNDLFLLIDPETADRMGRSQEIHTYLKESPFALAQVRGDAPSQNGQWGLPDQIYGYNIVVEDSVRITAKKGATANHAYSLASGTAYLLSRPGSLVGPEGVETPTYSTLVMFTYEEMTVERMDDPNNRRTVGSVVTDIGFEVTSVLSGFKFTGVFG